MDIYIQWIYYIIIYIWIYIYIYIYIDIGEAIQSKDFALLAIKKLHINKYKYIHTICIYSCTV